MKIIMVNKFLYPRGGAEMYMIRLGRYFEDCGHEVAYFGMADNQNTIGNNAGLYTVNMNFHGRLSASLLYPFRIIYSLEARRKLAKLIDDFQPDVIHLNNINFQLTPSVIDAAAGKGIPIIQTVHDYQMVCANHMMYDVVRKEPCEKCLRGSKWNCAKNNCIHASKLKSVMGSVEALFYQKRKTYTKVDRYICPSRFLEDKLLMDPIFRGKTMMVRNFIERANPDVNVEKGNYALYFGRLSEEKGFELFLESCRQLKARRFIVAGAGPLETLCRGLDNVEYVGFKTGKDLARLVSGALFSVYPSVWYENCPLSVLESQSLKTPVLVSNMGGIPELVEDGVTGVILKELTRDALAGEMERLFRDRGLLRTMSDNCLKKRADMMTLERYGDIVLRLYSEAIACHGR